MEKATISAVLGTIIGLLAGVGGMVAFGSARDNAERNELREEREAAHAAETGALKAQIADLQVDLDAARRAAQANPEIAKDHERLANEKGEAESRERTLREELARLRLSQSESDRLRQAEIDQLKALLEENGITTHLSPEEVQARIAANKTAFEKAFATKDKRAALDALWAVQKLGPAGYPTAIALWKQMAEDYGLNPFGQGPGTMGLTFQEYAALISDFGLVRAGLTDPEIDPAFRIASIYGAPWWSSEPAGERAKLVGDILLVSKGYETTAAIEALRDIPDPTSTRYLSEYLARNTDNAAARTAAINALAVKNTPDAWAAIEHAAQHDPDENVRRAAQNRLAARNPSTEGVLITWVGESSQAALAGIKVGDILTHYNGVRIKTLEDVNRAKADVKEDQTVSVVLLRGGETLNLQLGPGLIGINGTAVAPTK